MAASLLAIAICAPHALAIVNKPFIAPLIDDLPSGTRVDVDAATISYDRMSGIATAKGFVKMVYGPYMLIASKVSYNQKTGAFDANGSVELREPNGNVLQATDLSLSNKFREGFARHIKALLTNDATITAAFVKRIDGNITIFEKATYTACKDCRTRSGKPLWSIETDETTHDLSTHDLYHVNPRLKINGATVLKLPYWQQPDPSVTRRSGFLSPTITAGKAFGFGLVTPYFWALSPSTDLTFRPMWTTYQGPVADVEWRQATETGSYNLRGIGVHQFNNLAYPDNGEWRGAVMSSGRFQADENWAYGWNGTFATDPAFLKSYGYDQRKYAVNNVYASGLWDQTYVSAQMLNFGSLDPNISPDSLPYAMPFIMGETIDRDLPIGGQFELRWNAYSLHRTAPQQPFQTVSQGTDQTRATTSFDWHDQYFSDGGAVITPFANLRSDMLMTSNVPDGTLPGIYHGADTTIRVLPRAGVDMRWPFIAGTPYGSSIITPVMQIVSSANEGDRTAFGNEDAITLNIDHTSFFLADRFTGLDRYDGGTRADLGVTYSFLGNNGGFARASLGQSFRIAGQNSFVSGSGLSSNSSDLVGAFVVQPWDSLSLSYEARMKSDLSGFNRQEATASLSFDSFSTNVSFLDFGAEPAYGRKTREQWVSGDAKIGLKNGWSLFGGITYDFVASVMAKRTIGLEFDCQCMNFKVAYTGSEDSLSHVVEHKVGMSIEFATLGQTGADVSF